MAESGIGVEKEQEDLGGRGDKQEALDGEDCSILLMLKDNLGMA